MEGICHNQNDQSKDTNNHQLIVTLNCIYNLRKRKERIRKFYIGCNIAGFEAFNDVVVQVELYNGKKFTYAIRVEHSLRNCLSGKQKCSLFEYFKSYLEIQKTVPVEQLRQLIIYTKRPLEMQEIFQEYPDDSHEDYLFGCRNNADIHYQRYRLKQPYSSHMTQQVLDQAHPLSELVEEFTDVIFCKKAWDSKRSAGSYYPIMAKEIIECNGDHSKFRTAFVTGEGLSEEATSFRSSFECVMKEKFSVKGFGVFSISKLNCESYKRYYELKVDESLQKEDADIIPEWNQWEDVPTEKDLEEFSNRLVFYQEVPNTDSLKVHLEKQIGNIDRLSELLKSYSVYEMMDDVHVNRLFALYKLRNSVIVDPYQQLRFDDLSELQQEVKMFMSDDVRKYLCVTASQNVDCTVSRLKSVFEDQFACFNNLLLEFSYESFIDKWTELQSIMQDPKLVDIGLKCIVISFVTNDKIQEISERLAAVKVIFVGEELQTCFEDKFDINSIDIYSKELIKNREIRLSNSQRVTAGKLFSDQLFQKDNFVSVLELYRTSIEISGNELALDAHYLPRSVKWSVQKKGACDLVNQTDYRRLIICDQAGTGKSTEMIKVTLELRQKYQDHLVVYLSCNAAVSKWNGDIVDLINKSLTSRNESVSLVVESLFQQGKVILLLDGYDEVSCGLYKKLDTMVKDISQSKIDKVYIATRPHCESKIKQTLMKCGICHLEPFTEDAQLEYLKNFWNTDRIDNEEIKSRVETNAHEIVRKFRSMLKDSSLIGIPLQTYMIAVIYRDRIASVDFEVPKSHEIGSIYEEFIAFKFSEAVKKEFDVSTPYTDKAVKTLKEKFIVEHVEIAQKIYRDAPASKIQDLCSKAQHYGLVHLQPSAGFIHQTFLEYFQMLYFLTYTTAGYGEFATFMKQNLCTSRMSIATKFMDFHIDQINPADSLKPALSEIVLTSVFPEDFIPPSTGRLHPDKIREFNLYLRKFCSADEQYTLIRNCFNISVFNVLEVLYDSLQEDVKSQLRFCFGNRSESNCINLKLLGGNQFLQLLKLLLKKHPDNFVRSYLTAFDDDEEDFIEVACRKPFVQVLEWLTLELIPCLNREERSALEDYVGRRFAKYLELVVQHNNSQFLKELIGWVKRTWPIGNVNRFLQDRNVMASFVGNIEAKAATKPFKVEQRVEMVHYVSEFYSWAFEELGKVYSPFIDVVKNIQIDDIKRAFEESFSRKLDKD